MKRHVVLFLVLSIVIFLLFTSLSAPWNAAYGDSNQKSFSSGPSATTNASSLGFVAPSITSSPPAAGLNGKWSSMLNYTLERLNSSGIPDMARMLPNFNAPDSGKLSTGPIYSSAPAPMGLASYGLRNESGTISPYTYTTDSFEGSINISNVSEFYPGTSSPYSFSIQFNAVLTGVTIKGISTYEYWIQNVAFYSSRTHQLTFVDNIWNFSSPNAVINNGTFYSYTGNVVPGLYYYKIGPTYTVSAPFSLILYLNATNIANENSVFFNYTLTNASLNGRSGVFSSSYDKVQFNSTGYGPSTAVPDACFKVSGSTLSGTGAIPLDAELDLGGPGGGSTADFNQINASLNMYYRNNLSLMVPIGSAYDSGSATGETSSGVSAYYKGVTEHLFTGPSFISGLWNITSPSESGFYNVTATINPESAFVMISQGRSFSNSSAQLAPTGNGGSFITRLMPGSYSMMVMLSYHDPSSVYSIPPRSTGTCALGSITLQLNKSAGLYTPIYISGNAELGQLSMSGNGSEGNPYIIPGYQYLRSAGIDSTNTLNQAFTVVNDYLFPEFTGILVKDSSDYVILNGFKSPEGPPFQYVLSGKLNLAIAQAFGMTAANNLGMYFYNSSHIILTNSTISEAFPADVFSGNTYYNVPYVAGLTLWNVTSSLIEKNLICSQGSGLLIYNNASTVSGNYVWNNTFLNALVISNGSYYGSAPIGLTVESSGNTVFNNIFDTTITIVSIDGLYANIYNNGNVTYHDAFNISRRPATSSTVFDGEVLTGSIIGSSYQGGNFYYNYFGDGSSPYNGSGLGLAFPGQNIFNGSINDGFDFVPLQVYTTMVNVSASGLPSRQVSYFDINNAIYSIAYGNERNIYLPNGTYQIQGLILFNTNEEFVPTPYIDNQMLVSGTFYVHGPVGNIYIQYNLYMNVTVSETGVPIGTIWGFSIPQAGVGFTLDGGSVSIFLESGKIYQIFPQSVPGYYTDTFYPFTVGITPLNFTISYFPTGLPSSFSVTFHETGLPSGALWHIYIGTQEFNSTLPTVTIINFTDGTYTYNISTSGGYQNIQGQHFTVNQSNVTIDLMFTRTPGSSSALYIVLAAIAGLVSGVIISYAIMRQRSREITL